MRIHVLTKPGSKQNLIEKIGEILYYVNLKAPAKKGKANAAIIKLLSKYFNSKVKIVAGFKSKNKIIEIEE